MATFHYKFGSLEQRIG